MRALLGLIFAIAATFAQAQAYPAKPVRLIIPFPPGGSNDVVGRAVAAQLGERLGQSVVIVQYKGGGPALTDTIAGQVQMNIGSAVQNIPHVRSGKLRALGVGGKERIAALPDVPTFAEAGFPGAEATNWWGMVAPIGTPAAVLTRLQKDIEAVVESPEMQKRFQLEGAQALRMTPQEFGNLVAAETAKWTRVVKEAGIKAEGKEIMERFKAYRLTETPDKKIRAEVVDTTPR